MKKTALVTGRTDNIIPKTELRENLTAIMNMVYLKKKTIAISDRGLIISVISPVEGKMKSAHLFKKETKKVDVKKDPAFGIFKNDPRSNKEIFGELSGKWW